MSLRRPILKGLPTGESQPGISFQREHVHFPPTPEISAIYIAHSPTSYDRSAIVVSPNACSLPRRHCPDRTYVLTEGKGGARLLKSVQPKDMQKEDQEDEPFLAEYDQEAVRIDYFSFPSPSSMVQVAWSESDELDELLSPSEILSNCGQVPLFDVSVHDTHTRGASKPHDHVQVALPCFPHPHPPASERKRNLSPHDREKQGRGHTFSGGEDSHAPPLARSRRTRRAPSFTPDVLPDLGCLGGF